MNGHKQKKRQTSRRVEGIPHSYLVGIGAKKLLAVTRFASSGGPVSEFPTIQE